MLQLKLTEVLEEKGNKTPLRWLIEYCGLQKSKAYRIFRKKNRSLNLDDLTLLCTKLNCTPNDLLFWDETPGTKLPKNHPCMTQLTKPQKVKSWFEIMNELSPADNRKLRELALKKINQK